MISWFTDIVALAMNTVYQGDARAMVALFFVSALTEVGMPFPFVIDGVLVVTSYETGLWSLPVARIIIALLLGRQFGSAVIYWLSRFLGNRFINWLGKRFPKLPSKLAWLNTRLSRRAPLAVAIVRLTPGLLTSSSVAAGCIRMRYHHLVLGIVLASVIADGALVIIGVFTKYGLSILGFTPSTWEGIVALAVVILLVGFVRWLWLRRRAH